MRHGGKINHLGVKSAHRRHLLANMTVSLIREKRIFTTLAKAKALRKYVEPILTRSKNNTTHARRVVFSYLRDKSVIDELFGNVAEKIAARQGGYTRILKIGNRRGDNADTCFIELVDFRGIIRKDKAATTAKKKRTRRGGRGGAAKAPAAVQQSGKEATADGK